MLSVVILNVIMLSVIMMSVIILNVIILSVVAPKKFLAKTYALLVKISTVKSVMAQALLWPLPWKLYFIIEKHYSHRNL
jgi:hypothetical protein